MQNNNIISKNTATKEKETQEKVEEYKDIEGLSIKKLNFGLWYVEHRRQFHKIFIGLLILVGAVSWSYSIYGFTYYITRGMDEDELLARELVQTTNIGHNYIAQIAAQNLKYYPVNIFKTAKGKYDLAVRIKNPNQKWWVEFDYYFLINNKQIGESQNFILPNEDKYLMALAQDFSAKPTNIQFIIKNIKWSRINLHKIVDWQDYKNDHLKLTIEDVKFIPASKNNLSDKISLNQVNFKSINKTPYNYLRVDFLILLYNGQNVVGVNKYSLNEFMSGEERLVQVRWPGKIGRVNNVEVIPEINIMRDDIYIKFEGGIGEEK